MKIFIWTVSIMLGLIMAAMAFVFYPPDYDLYTVRSGSMEPAIKTGDAVIVTGCG